MFRVQNNVPDVYIQESRDFQLLSRLYDLAFQSSRYSINSMEDITSTRYCNERSLPLLQTKLGFFTSRNIDNNALRSILSAYPQLVRLKGTSKCILLLINLFQRLTDSAIQDYEIDNKNRIIVVTLRRSASYIETLNDLLMMLMPTGYTTRFVVSTPLTTATDSYGSTDIVNIKQGIPTASYHTSETEDIPQAAIDGSEYGMVSDPDATKSLRRPIFGSEVAFTQVVSLADAYRPPESNESEESKKQ